MRRPSPYLTLGLAALLLAPAAAACQQAAEPSRVPAPRRVLFLGNSLTYYNDLPEAVAGIALAAGAPLAVGTVAAPNFGLIDHLAEGSAARAALAAGGWDVVVLQQGPTTLPANRDSLVLWTRMLDTLIRAAGARPALFMVWPVMGQEGGFAAVEASYRAAALAVDGSFLPAGVAWKLALEPDPTLALYGPDGFHPSPLGTFLAALAIYEGLTGRDVRTFSPPPVVDGTRLALSESTLRLLQEAAHRANARRN